MKKENKICFYTGVGLLILFLLWTLSVNFINVEAIGPQSSEIGFSAFNACVRDFIGVNMSLYVLTDLLSALPLMLVAAYAVLGVAQLIKRKSVFKVDRDLLFLGGFYAVVFAVYLLFEVVVINYRPILIDGALEASYPSSTTMLSLCVMITTAMQLHWRIKKIALRRCLVLCSLVFGGFMLIGRILSGVHWITDIIGGILFSVGAVMIYYSICKFEKKGCFI